MQIRLLRDSMMYFRGKCPDRISAREFAAGNFRIYTDFDICCIHLSLRHGQLNERLIVKPLELLYSADYSGILPPGVECSMGALPDYSGISDPEIYFLFSLYVKTWKTSRPLCKISLKNTFYKNTSISIKFQ